MFNGTPPHGAGRTRPSTAWSASSPNKPDRQTRAADLRSPPTAGLPAPADGPPPGKMKNNEKKDLFYKRSKFQAAQLLRLAELISFRHRFFKPKLESEKCFL